MFMFVLDGVYTGGSSFWGHQINNYKPCKYLRTKTNHDDTCLSKRKDNWITDVPPLGKSVERRE
jgi:hypothetical protein